MSEQGYDTQGLNIPIDKIPIGILAFRFISNTIDVLRDNRIESFVSLVNHFDDFIVQYKDDKYEDDMKKLNERIKARKSFPDKAQQDSLNDARAVFRIIMMLLQRQGFMPVKTYEGDLLVDLKYEKDLEEDVE